MANTITPPLTDDERAYYDRVVDHKMVREAVQFGADPQRIAARVSEVRGGIPSTETGGEAARKST